MRLECAGGLRCWWEGGRERSGLPPRAACVFQPRMDQYFHQMEKIVKERKTSSRIRFMLQDVIDLRQVSA